MADQNPYGIKSATNVGNQSLTQPTTDWNQYYSKKNNTYDANGDPYTYDQNGKVLGTGAAIKYSADAPYGYKMGSNDPNDPTYGKPQAITKEEAAAAGLIAQTYSPQPGNIFNTSQQNGGIIANAKSAVGNNINPDTGQLGAGAGGPPPLGGMTTQTDPNVNVAAKGPLQVNGGATSVGKSGTADYGNVSQQMATDWLNGFKPSGGPIPWAGGTLSDLQPDGSKIWTSADGKQVKMTSNMDLNQLARENPAIAAQWAMQYGYSVPTQASTAGQFTTPNQSTYNAAQLKDPTKWNVTPEQTIEGRMTNLMDPNNPIIQQARQQALAQMNDRGLMNSGMAVSAGMDAAYKTILPIAQNDAATYAKAAGYNADEANQFSMKNVDALNTASQFNASEQNKANLQTQDINSRIAMQNADSINKIQMQNADAANKIKLANIDSATRTNLAEIEANYKVLMQSNASASDLYKQISSNLTNISANKDMDENAKKIAYANQLNLLRNGMSIIGKMGNLNLDNLLVFDDITGGSGVDTNATSSSTTGTTSSNVNPYKQGTPEWSRWEMEHNSNISGAGGI